MFKILFTKRKKYSAEYSEELLARLLGPRLGLNHKYKGIKLFVDEVLDRVTCLSFKELEKLDSMSTKKMLKQLSRLEQSESIKKLKRLWVVRSYKCDFDLLREFMKSDENLQ